MHGRVVFRIRRWLLSLTIVLGVCYHSLSSRRAIYGRSRTTRSEMTSTRGQQTSLTSRYVTLCQARLHGNHRTGNHLFLLAGMLYAAQLTGREVSMPAGGWLLDDTFQLDEIDRYQTGPNCPYHEFADPPKAIFYHGDDNLDTSEGRTALQKNMNRTLGLCGLYQTYRYADAVAPTLRTLLRFRPEVLDAAHKILEDGRPPEWAAGSYHRVGLHIRRGDFLDRQWAEYGFSVVNRRFVVNAVDYFASKFARFQLVVASDDPCWIGAVLREKFSPASNSSTSRFMSMTGSVAVTLSRGQSAAVDLALLAACDAMVVSTTSRFGWWAAWLVNSTTVFYDRWSRVGSRFSRDFDHRRYFPPHWIPLH